jgi:hypothetical protein
MHSRFALLGNTMLLSKRQIVYQEGVNDMSHCEPGIGGVFTSVGIILVLYILLVIILRSGWY